MGTQSTGRKPNPAALISDLPAEHGLGQGTPLVITSSKGSLLQCIPAMSNAVLATERRGVVVIEAPLQHADMCLSAQACFCMWTQQRLQVSCQPWQPVQAECPVSEAE